jgi:hypothetical protein
VAVAVAEEMDLLKTQPRMEDPEAVQVVQRRR